MYYIGADIHSSTCSFCVIDKEGKEIDSTKIATNGRLIRDYLKSFEGNKTLTFEECEISGWMYGISKLEVDEVLVCNPVANKSYKKAKTDKLDARNLAKLLSGGFLKPVYHDGSERERFRTLMSGYQDLVEEAVRMKNRYKSIFRRIGEKAIGKWLYNDESFLDGLKSPDAKFIGRQIYNLLEVLEESRKEYVKEIEQTSKKFKEISHLKTIPGIGIIQSAKIVSQVVNPERFPNKYKYYSYCGLVSHQRISGEALYGKEKIWGNRILKCVYKMAAHSILSGDSGLRKYYDFLREKGMGHKSAYNALSRKIAAISLSIWKNNEDYDDKRIIDGLIK